MQPDEDHIKIPVLGLLAGGLIALAFASGAFDALLSSHFTSWHRLSAEPTDDTARSIEELLPVARAITMVGAAVFGYTTLRRVSVQGYKVGAIRLVVLAFSPIIVELTNMGTQDGAVPDLDKLPIHSLVLLVLIALVPGLIAAADLLFLRKVFQQTVEVAVG